VEEVVAEPVAGDALGVDEAGDDEWRVGAERSGDMQMPASQQERLRLERKNSPMSPDARFM
jgi:hypothetical protein